MLKDEFFNVILDRALVHIKKDRARFTRVYEITEEYCKKHKLIISDCSLLTDDIDETVKIYNVYSINPFKHSNDLTNELFKATNDRYLYLKTIEKQKEFVICADLRAIVFFHKLQRYKNKNFVVPCKINDLLYMPPEIEIINIYKQLYNLNFFGDYEKNKTLEQKLFDSIVERRAIIRRNIKTKFKGGVDELKASNDDELKANGANDGKGSPFLCPNKQRSHLNIIKLDIMMNWLPRYIDDVILIGTWAFNWLRKPSKDDLIANTEKIQIITSINPQEILGSIQRQILKITNFRISSREQTLFIPNDERTKRFTFYIHIQTKHGIVEKPFLDLFNSTSFELIPYYTFSGINCGNYWVILRFLFIDLWVVNVVYRLGILSDKVLDEKMQYLWHIIKYFHNYKYAKDYSKKTKYLGLNRNENIDKKISMITKREFFLPYFPSMYKKKGLRKVTDI